MEECFPVLFLFFFYIWLYTLFFLLHSVSSSSEFFLRPFSS